MQPILLHTCCAPCSAAVLEWLLKNAMTPTVFFYNPNIAPLAEYEKRKAELVRHCQRLGVAFIDGDYDHEDWLEATKGLETNRSGDAGATCVFTCVLKKLRGSAWN